jgi:hypothetical protein
MRDTEDTMDIVELTAHFGLPDVQQNALFGWTGEDDVARLWTAAEADELFGIWQACSDETGAYAGVR